MSSTDKKQAGGLNLFEKYLTVWVGLCIAGGIALGRVVPGIAPWLDSCSIYAKGAPVVSIPIAICLFFMMYPIMVKIDFAEVVRAGKTPKPVLLTLVVNWLIKPFTMAAIAWLFLGVLFRDFLPGMDTLKDGSQTELWRSYIAGCILLGIAPCTAMVLLWGSLAKGNDGHTLVMVAINSLAMLLLFGPLGGLLLGISAIPIPWEALLLSVGIYVALPLAAGYVTRRWILAVKGRDWFEAKFLHWLSPISMTALLATLVLLFSLKGDVILANPLTILWIAIPLFIQTVLIFVVTYAIARFLKLNYRDAAPSAMIGASNHFEVAIATATMLFGLSSGAALATVVGVLIEVPVMLMLVRICLRTRGKFPAGNPADCSDPAPGCCSNWKDFSENTVA